jgi:hypothetical protein
MSDESVDVQLARIEQGIHSIKGSLQRLEREMQEHVQFRMMMIEFKAKLEGLNIEQRLRGHGDRVNTLEGAEDQRKGAKWLVGVIGAALGIIGMGGVALIMRAFKL